MVLNRAMRKNMNYTSSTPITRKNAYTMRTEMQAAFLSQRTYENAVKPRNGRASEALYCEYQSIAWRINDELEARWVLTYHRR